MTYDDITNMTAIQMVISTIWSGIKTFFETIFTAIQLVVTTYFEIYKTIITTVLTAISVVVTTIWNAIKTVVTIVVSAIQTFITTAWNTIQTVTSTVFNAIRTVFTTVWNGIKSVVMDSLTISTADFDTLTGITIEPFKTDPFIDGNMQPAKKLTGTAYTMSVISSQTIMQDGAENLWQDIRPSPIRNTTAPMATITSTRICICIRHILRPSTTWRLRSSRRQTRR